MMYKAVHLNLDEKDMLCLMMFTMSNTAPLLGVVIALLDKIKSPPALIFTLISLR